MSEHYRLNKIKEFLKISKEIRNLRKKKKKLISHYAPLSYEILPNRLQESSTPDNTSTPDFIVPENWGTSDPCGVVVYRKGYEDVFVCDIINLGTNDDVKTFYCPHFNKDIPCNHNCRYRRQNNEYIELGKQMRAINKEYNLIKNNRAILWKQIFEKKSK